MELLIDDYPGADATSLHSPAAQREARMGGSPSGHTGGSWEFGKVTLSHVKYVNDEITLW